MKTGYYFYRTKPHNMKPEIKKQQNLLVKALSVLHQIETIENLFGGIDNVYKAERIEILQTEYAEIMASLAGELVKLAKPITNNQTQD